MNLWSKIRLSWRFGRLTYVISAIITLASASIVLADPFALPACLLIKAFSIPVILYLFSTFSRNIGIYFYLNLGISRREYYLIPFVVEFVAFVLIMVICSMIGYAIS